MESDVEVMTDEAQQHQQQQPQFTQLQNTQSLPQQQQQQPPQHQYQQQPPQYRSLRHPCSDHFTSTYPQLLKRAQLIPMQDHNVM